MLVTSPSFETICTIAFKSSSARSGRSHAINLDKSISWSSVNANERSIFSVTAILSISVTSV